MNMKSACLLCILVKKCFFCKKLQISRQQPALADNILRNHLTDYWTWLNLEIYTKESVIIGQSTFRIPAQGTWALLFPI